MVKVEIKGGICGFTTRVHAEDKTGYQAAFRMETDCPNWQKVDAILGGKPLNMMTELFKDKKTGTLHSQVLDISLKTIPHVSCPVISGLLKALEVSVGLALPRDARIRFME
jgi:hypothetical protein